MQEVLQQAFDKVSEHASHMQQLYKQVSVQLVQAQMTIKNYSDTHVSDAILVAQAKHASMHKDGASARHPSGPPSEISGRSHGTKSSAAAPGSLGPISECPHGPDALGGSHPTSANPGTVPTTHSVSMLSRSDPSAAGHAPSVPAAPPSVAGSTSSSLASYLPGRVGFAAATTTAEGNASAPDPGNPLYMSAQLASSQLKARLQQQRADAAESRERLLQRRLAELEASVAGGKPSGATDKRVDVLKVRLTILLMSSL
jgi:hypothetical protein